MVPPSRKIAVWVLVTLAVLKGTYVALSTFYGVDSGFNLAPEYRYGEYPNCLAKDEVKGTMSVPGVWSGTLSRCLPLVQGVYPSAKTDSLGRQAGALGSSEGP